MQSRYKSIAAVALLLLGFAGLTGAIVFSQPAEGASVTGMTQMQEATIEGSGPSGKPSEIMVNVNGTVKWENLNAYDAYVNVFVTNETEDEYRIAREEFYLGDLGGKTSYSFDGVGGDIMSVSAQTGLDQRYFMTEFDGDTQVSHVPITVEVAVCEYDLQHGGVCESFTDHHNVTVKVHNEPDENGGNGGGGGPPGNDGEPSVTGTTSIDGHIAFAGDESDDRPPEEGTPTT